MQLSVFDLNCDTPYLMLQKAQPLSVNQLAVSLEAARDFSRYVQVMALWTDNALKDEDGWQQMHRMLNNLKSDPALTGGKALLCDRLTEQIPRLPTLLLGVEDARILSGRLERIGELYCLGIRILTPLWRGTTIIGGSHDTSEGLTAFGWLALKDAAERGMLLDISHASERSAEQIFEICETCNRPVIASHSNAYKVCAASRNLQDWQIDRIIKTGGLIGLNFYGPFLCKEKDPSVATLLSHIDYFLARGAENVLCLGGDMDGCDLPHDMQGLSSLPYLVELMQRHGFCDGLIHKIFFENANRFFLKHL